MAVSKVSASEIEQLRGNNVVINSPVAKKPKTDKQEIRYVDKFSDKKIAEFFAPYGYIEHERSQDGGTILVICNDCQIIFDDFTVMAEGIDNLFLLPELNFFGGFTELCQQANTTPSQAISDRLEEEVFNPMPYYVDRKKKFNENNLNRIAHNQVYGKLLKASVKKQKHRENLASLNKTYGSSDPERIADTLARLNPNQ